MFSMLSEKGNELKVYEGNKFSKNRKTKKGQKWRCTYSTCTSHIFTDDDDNFKEIINEHNHIPDPTLARQVLSNAVKRKAVADIGTRPTKHVRKELPKLPEQVRDALTITDLRRARINSYVQKRSSLPPLPKNVLEVNEAIEQMEVNTRSKNENFVLINDSQNNIIVFGTRRNLHNLANRNTILMDGTFQYCVQHFFQMFTIHTVENGVYIPLLFCLLPNKETITYKLLFEKLKEICLQDGIRFNPRQIVIDFEQSIRSAVEDVWPESVIVACRFHLTQSWYRKIQTLGLSTQYGDDDSDSGKWLRWIFGISLLDPEDAKDSFVFDFMPLLADELLEFSNYLVDNYIGNDCKFPPTLWASARLDGERTTNACESFHAHFAKNFASSHPNIYIYIDTLLDIQEEIEISLQSVHNEVRINNNRKYQKHIRYLRRKRTRYENIEDEFSRFDYVKCASAHYKKN